MTPAKVALVVLVLGVVALAIYLALRPSDTTAQVQLGAGGVGSTRASAAISGIGSSAVDFASSIAQAAG